MNTTFVRMSLDDFTRFFLPMDLAASHRPRTLEDVFLPIPYTGGASVGFYAALERCIDKTNLCPGYALEPIENDSACDNASQSNICAALVYEDDFAAADESLGWALHRLSFLRRPHCTRDDPFENLDNDGKVRIPRNTGRRTDEARRIATLQHLTTQARIMFSHQHRCFAFSVLILGEHARLVRWDRAGAVVTDKFEYKHTPHLASFLHTFARMSPEQQGADVTAELVDFDSDDFRLMLEVANHDVNGSSYARDLFHESIQEPDWACWKLRVPSGDGSEESREFLVGKPLFLANELRGRATRGYVAFDCLGERFVFLKDVWRVSFPELQQEGDVLQTLQKAGVKHIPTFICHGDIDGQRSLTQEHATSDRLASAYVHYRLAVEEVCRPLGHHRDGQELVGIVADCVEAHGQAVERAGLMHCDISAENILIFEKPVLQGVSEWRGILCDWELSRPVHDGPNSMKEAVRFQGATGTQAYMSVHSLDHPDSPITVADELESFFHVLFNVALNSTENNIPNLEEFLTQYFHSCPADGRCGSVKRTAMIDGRFMHQDVPIMFADSAEASQWPLNVLLPILAAWFSARYALEHFKDIMESNRDSNKMAKKGGIKLRRVPPLLRYFDFTVAITWCRDRVAQLKTHDTMRQLLQIFLPGVTQPADDKSSTVDYIGRNAQQDSSVSTTNRKRSLEEEPVDLPLAKRAKYLPARTHNLKNDR
ncbi:hypothetical protein BKA93DRAFT_516810 [Sparassis latifolia]